MSQGYGTFTVAGGDGSKSGNVVGGGGAGGRIAMHFADNKTFAGDFDAYGGLSDGGHSDGGPGTVFFYHTGKRLVQCVCVCVCVCACVCACVCVCVCDCVCDCVCVCLPACLPACLVCVMYQYVGQ